MEPGSINQSLQEPEKTQRQEGWFCTGNFLSLFYQRTLFCLSLSLTCNHTFYPLTSPLSLSLHVHASPPLKDCSWSCKLVCTNIIFKLLGFEIELSNSNSHKKFSLFRFKVCTSQSAAGSRYLSAAFAHTTKTNDCAAGTTMLVLHCKHFHLLIHA